MSGRANFASVRCPANLPAVKAMAVADVDNDGVLDLLAVQADGAIVRISDKNEGQAGMSARSRACPMRPNNLAVDVRLASPISTTTERSI